jgi:protein TonB
MLHLLPERGLYRPDPKSNLYSIAIHAAVILLLAALASNQVAPISRAPATHITDPILAPLTLRSDGGGGGGTSMPAPASKGDRPPIATRVFVPPEAVILNANPKLPIAPAIIAPPDALVPQVSMDRYGDPISKFLDASNGRGSRLGIGDGSDGGVGNNVGPGTGSGPCCGADGTTYTSGVSGVTAPIVIFQVEPQFSEEARKAKFSGVVVLDIVVDASGNPRDIRVVRTAGMGLDEQAVAAVRQWRFKPGTKSGKAVAVHARVDVSFHLL